MHKDLLLMIQVQLFLYTLIEILAAKSADLRNGGGFRKSVDLDLRMRTARNSWST